jgi:hypothetical protein
VRQLEGRLDATTCADEKVRFSESDVAMMCEYRQRKVVAQREGVAVAQAERVGALTAASGSRREAEVMRRQLRERAERGEFGSIVERVRALVEAFPRVAGMSPMKQLAIYYGTYHVITDLFQLDRIGAPAYTAVDRAFRKVV